MANDDAISARGGLLPITWPSLNGARVRYYRITTSAAADFFLGQPVDLDANGRVTFGTPGDNNPLLGSVVGFIDTNFASIPSGMDSLTQGSYLPANKDANALVSDDPNQLYMIQEDTGGSALAETNIGNHATFIYRSSSGNTTTGYSTVELDRSDAAADTGGALQILGLARFVNSDGTNNGFGNYAKLIVRIAHHRLSPAISQTAV